MFEVRKILHEKDATFSEAAICVVGTVYFVRDLRKEVSIERERDRGGAVVQLAKLGCGSWIPLLPGRLLQHAFDFLLPDAEILCKCKCIDGNHKAEYLDEILRDFTKRGFVLVLRSCVLLRQVPKRAPKDRGGRDAFGDFFYAPFFF